MPDTTIPESIVKQEFYKSTEKAHIIACWVGIVLNLAWFVSDFFVIPTYWIPFLGFRLSVSVISLIVLVFKKQFNISIFTCAFILVLGISVQNAYMWSVMDVEHLQKHTFAYIALFIGVGMLVLWDFKLSVILLIVTIISNIAFYVANSSLAIDIFLTNGGMLVLTVAIFCVFLIRNRYRLTYKEIKSRLELEKSKALIEFQKEEVDHKNEEIISSLRYAKRLQEALLPPKNLLESFLKDNYFILYKPRDIVCGDFYWARKIKTTPVTGKQEDYLLLAVADCTGHGVPGAFMSLLGSNFLHQSAVDKDVNSPAQALDFLNQKIITTLNHGYGGIEIRDGMDISLIAINLETKQLAYSGANNPIYIVRNKSLETLKANKQAIGNMNDVVLPFDNYVTQLHDGDCIYLFTDGYADQFGGPKGKKLMRKLFEKVLIQNSEKPMPEQKEALEATFKNWKGELEQVDDVCVVGIRI
ncbi:MAG: serine/threonine-protein phosphatase [Bacteroidia bacterium]|nr:serine/threonine-protein phosphatase [Bacteroidia bacterium]